MKGHEIMASRQIDGFEYLYNPTECELNALDANCSQGARLLYYTETQELYAWDALKNRHNDVINILGLQDNAIRFFIRGGVALSNVALGKFEQKQIDALKSSKYNFKFNQ